MTATTVHSSLHHNYLSHQRWQHPYPLAIITETVVYLPSAPLTASTTSFASFIPNSTTKTEVASQSSHSAGMCGESVISILPDSTIYDTFMEPAAAAATIDSTIASTDMVTATHTVSPPPTVTRPFPSISKPWALTCDGTADPLFEFLDEEKCRQMLPVAEKLRKTDCKYSNGLAARKSAKLFPREISCHSVLSTTNLDDGGTWAFSCNQPLCSIPNFSSEDILSFSSANKFQSARNVVMRVRAKLGCNCFEGEIVSRSIGTSPGKKSWSLDSVDEKNHHRFFPIERLHNEDLNRLKDLGRTNCQCSVVGNARFQEATSLSSGATKTVTFLGTSYPPMAFPATTLSAGTLPVRSSGPRSFQETLIWLDPPLESLDPLPTDHALPKRESASHLVERFPSMSIWTLVCDDIPGNIFSFSGQARCMDAMRRSDDWGRIKCQCCERAATGAPRKCSHDEKTWASMGWTSLEKGMPSPPVRDVGNTVSGELSANPTVSKAQFDSSNLRREITHNPKPEENKSWLPPDPPLTKSNLIAIVVVVLLAWAFGGMLWWCRGIGDRGKERRRAKARQELKERGEEVGKKKGADDGWLNWVGIGEEGRAV